MQISLQVPTLEVNQTAQQEVGHEVYHHILGLGLRIQVGVDYQQEMKGKEQQVGKVHIAWMQIHHVKPAHYIEIVLFAQRLVFECGFNISL